MPTEIQNLPFAEFKRFVKRKLYGKGYYTVLEYLMKKAPEIELLAYQCGLETVNNRGHRRNDNFQQRLRYVLRCSERVSYLSTTSNTGLEVERVERSL
ncbi:hypothetical protein EVAR_103170_1 [Eumeta japonica]|uniref:Uncharacterized protein n=1 Tax=Eumeta variegata TaxID=151549 RepID=A0A4C1YQ80_EUMVA|nr:hypothetical protein EVAR_103170_1 [Eumeta japonica]